MVNQMGKIPICIHRFLYPIDINNAPKGCGNCAICIRDEKNRDCSQYFPISTSIPPVEKTAYFFSNFQPKH